MPNRARHEEIRVDHQAALVDFLRTDMDLAFTLLPTAKVERSSDPAHSKAATAKAREALQAVRHFESRLDDAALSEEIHTRANQLETAILAMENSA